MEGNQALCIFCCKKVNRGSNPDYDEPDDEEILERFLLFTDRNFNCIDKKHSNRINTKALSKSSTACPKCFGIIDYYCHLYHRIECLKLQLNCQLKKVWKVMSYADRVPARVKAFREWCNGNDLISTMDTNVNGEDQSSGGPIKFRQTFKRRCRLYLGRTSPRLHIPAYSSKTQIKNDHGHQGPKHLPVNLNSSTGVPPAILEIDKSPPRSTSLPIIIRVIKRQSIGFSGKVQRKGEMKTKPKLNKSVNLYSEESNSHSYSDGYEDDYNEPVAKQRRTNLEFGEEDTGGIPSPSSSNSSSKGGGEHKARASQHNPPSSSGSYQNGGDPMKSHSKRPYQRLETLLNPDSDYSLQDEQNLSLGIPGLNNADVNDHDEGEGGVLSASDLEEFSRYFKRRRTKFGYSQADVGVSMSSIYGDVFSQTTISRFEALQLSYKNLLKLQPVMQKWLEGVETGITPTIDQEAAQMFKKRKKRTNIPPHIKSTLEMYFHEDSRPSGEKVLAIANQLELEKEVVRVWFCNRRAKVATLDNFVPGGTDTGLEQGYTDDSRDPLSDVFEGEEGRPEETNGLKESTTKLIVKQEPIDHPEDEAVIMVMESPVIKLRNNSQTSTVPIPNRGYQ